MADIVANPFAPVLAHRAIIWLAKPFRWAAALAALVAAQLVGNALGRAWHLPLPGPLIGMVMLAVPLSLRGEIPGEDAVGVTGGLGEVSNALIRHMGLLFVPAGAGIVAELALVRQNALPILAGLLVSTVAGLAVTGLVMHHAGRATALDSCATALDSRAAALDSRATGQRL